MKKDKDLYQVLGVERSATAKEIRTAYYAKAKYMHPDQGGSAEMFHKLQEAYAVLSDGFKRKQYDSVETMKEMVHQDFADDENFRKHMAEQRKFEEFTKSMGGVNPAGQVFDFEAWEQAHGLKDSESGGPQVINSYKDFYDQMARTRMAEEMRKKNKMSDHQAFFYRQQDKKRKFSTLALRNMRFLLKR